MLLCDNLTAEDAENAEGRPEDGVVVWSSRRSRIILKSISNTQVGAPVEVVDIDTFSEEAAVAGTEVELQGNGRVEFVFEAEDAVGAAFAEVVAGSDKADPGGVGDVAPAVADAEAQAEHPVETFSEMAFEHKVGVEFEVPEGQAFKAEVLAVEAVGFDNLGAEVELEGEVVASEGLEC